MVFDRIISSYIKYIIAPKVLRFEHPGFLIEDFTKVGQNTVLRVVFLPETLLEKLEHLLSPKFLYMVGKKFSYFYSQISNLPTIKDASHKRFLRFVDFYVKFVEGMQSSGLKHKVEIKRKIFRLKMKNYIVCSKTGKGYLLPLGGVAGIWAWMMQDNEIEAAQPYCEGRGNNFCLVVAAPYSVLIRMKYKPFRFSSLEKINFDYQTYNSINLLRESKFAKNSLRDMIDSGLLEYKQGIIKYKKERFFLCGLELIYVLEKELKKIKNGLKILWDCSFDFGKRLAKLSGKQEPCKFIMDFFPALGFGDILATKGDEGYKIIVNHFPWLHWYKDIDFTVFRGMLSGVISRFTEKRIILKNIEKDIRSGSLSLYISE